MNEQTTDPNATTAAQAQPIAAPPQQFAPPPQQFAPPPQGQPIYPGYPQPVYPGYPQQFATPPQHFAQPNFIPQQPQQPSPEEGHIPKRLAAIEAYKHLRTTRILGFSLLIGPFLVMIGNVFHPFAGMGLAAGVAAGSLFFIYRTQGEMKRLETKYAIDPKAIR